MESGAVTIAQAPKDSWCRGWATAALVAESNEARTPQFVRLQWRPEPAFPFCKVAAADPYSPLDCVGCSGETTGGIGGVIGVMIRGCWKALCPQGAVIQSRRKGAAAITASTISVA